MADIDPRYVKVTRGGQPAGIMLPRRYEEVLERIAELKRARDQVFPNMHRVANILDGGERAVQALIGENQNSGAWRDMPVANYLRDALDALASRLSTVPDLSVDPPTHRKSDRNESRLKQTEKKQRIVEGYDDADELDQMMPQLARWLPGASYAVMTIDPCMVDGYPYPKATLHSPLDTMLAQWTPIQQPEDCGLTLKVPVRELKARYPHVADKLDERETAPGWGGGVILDRQRDGIGVEVVRYYDRHGTWRFVPDKHLLLDFNENPLKSGPSFVAFSKYNYSRLRGEFDDLIGLMISMARLQIMAEIAVRKNITSPVNLFGGEPLSGPYKEGFGVQNVFDINQRVEIPNSSIQFEAWQQIDRFERQLSIEATVPPQDRGEAGMSFVTGRGMNELGARVERKVGEYHNIQARGTQRRDAKMLEFDVEAYPDITKPVAGIRGTNETYRPSTHVKDFHTTRAYGALAGLEQAAAMNALSIMDAANWTSKRWTRRNVPNLRDVSQIEDEIRTEAAEEAFMAMLLTHANNSESPEHIRALQAVVDMLPTGETRRIAERWLTERGEEVPEDELEALMAAQAVPQPGLPPPDPASVMQAITAGGAPRGGPQVVRSL